MKDLYAEKRMLWVAGAVNRGKLHTPKYHRANRPIRLTPSDVERLLTLKQLQRARDEDWMFPNHRETGPLRHKDLLGRVLQPVAEDLGLPHVTWCLLRHRGATQMVEASVPIKAAQERLGHSRPDILLKFYATSSTPRRTRQPPRSVKVLAHVRPPWSARIGLLRKGLAVIWQPNGSQAENLLNVSY